VERCEGFKEGKKGRKVWSVEIRMKRKGRNERRKEGHGVLCLLEQNSILIFGCGNFQ
jgi:hypothetical protein